MARSLALLSAMNDGAPLATMGAANAGGDEESGRNGDIGLLAVTAAAAATAAAFMPK